MRVFWAFFEQEEVRNETSGSYVWQRGIERRGSAGLPGSVKALPNPAPGVFPRERLEAT